VLPCVKEAEQRIAQQGLGHEYLPFKGLEQFCKLSAEFAFGKDSKPLNEGRLCTVQCVSGSGGLRVGAEFLARFKPPAATNLLYLPNPTYVNHNPIFALNNFQLRSYTYYNTATNSLDINGFLQDIKEAPPMSTFLLHACAHNPTGTDPNMEQWKQIEHAMRQKQHICFFDSAYQGFGSGDVSVDGAGFRHFVSMGNQIIVAQSYSKNFGLYGQRVGALNIVTGSPAETTAVSSQLNQVIRPMYSNPPLHGARIVATVLGDPQLFNQWKIDVKTMADRIINCRQELVSSLKKLGSKRDWSHITNQIGMFAYSGLAEAEVQALRNLHVYMNLDGRMSISGINSKNVQYLAQCIHQVTK